LKQEHYVKENLGEINKEKKEAGLVEVEGDEEHHKKKGLGTKIKEFFAGGKEKEHEDTGAHTA
jgi:hypothetical protein